ncbi:DUF2267 domain-containing protein [Actinoplanes palleronii]|uniref:DUF2267 domain-containing protein n=1 Tax=Actinoplanes palleronii TaxID=113570 RepID=A0ABQ4BCC5_9ACTN|nr:DUF2267 domain-containing protein [Actinoplanes palleronii]GIE68235.1 hypothetical protein Apa02nite_043430 [Actinoplanes palleronii]
MASTTIDVFDHAVHTAQNWLAGITRRFGDGDRHAAHRILRAWLHTLRDRLPAAVAADFAAQLPELFRGAFYDGWQPGRAPVKYGPEQYRRRFALEAQIPVDEVDTAAAVVTAELRDRMSPGQVDQVLEVLPDPIRRILRGPAETGERAEPPVHREPDVAELDPDQLARAARRNTELLIAASLHDPW